MLILDASMTLAWLFDDETTLGAEQVFERVAEGGALVPAIWWLEIANVLRTAVRRGRCDEGYADCAFNRLRRLPIETDDQTARRAWTDILALSRSENLTPYDASYLELAVRRQLPLASGDRNLLAAAGRRGLEVLAR